MNITYSNIILISFSLVLVLASCADREVMDRALPESGEIKINQNRILAGKPIFGKIEFENAPKLNKYYIQVSGPKLEKFIQLDLRISKSLNFEIADSLLKHSSQYTILLFSDHGLIAKNNFSVLPTKPSGKIEMYTGPKSIWLAGKQKSMISAIPKDEFGNAMGDGYKIRYSIKYPKKSRIESMDRVANLFSSTQIVSEKEIGKILIGARVGEAGTREQEIQVIGDCPTEIYIFVESMNQQADARQFVHIKTDQLSDRYDNIIADGTLVVFEVFNKKQIIAKYQSLTIDGIANVYIQNPDRKSEWHIQAHVCGAVLSNLIPLSFEEYFNNYTISFQKQQNQLIVGPIKTKTGQFLSDGTLVDFLFVSVDLKYQTQLQLVDGQTILELANTSLSKGEYKVEVDVLGLKKRYKLYWSGE